MTYFPTNYTCIFTYGPYAVKSEPRVVILPKAERPRERQGL